MNRQCFARYRSKPSRARSKKAVMTKKPTNESSVPSVLIRAFLSNAECRVVGSKNKKHRLSRRAVRNTSTYRNVLCALAICRANRDSRRNVRCVEPSSASRTYSAAKETRRSRLMTSALPRIESSRNASPISAVVPGGKETPPRSASSPTFASRAFASCDERDEVKSEPNPRAKKSPSAPPPR